MAYDPDRGDIVVIEWSGPKGSTEMIGRHHALVLSERQFNVATGQATACPITRQVKGSPFEVVLRNLRITVGCVVVSQIKNMDYIIRKAQFVEKATPDLLEEAQAIACEMIGCEEK